MQITTAVASAVASFAVALALSLPAEAQHAQHADMLKQRGAAAMGFDQDKAVHHFLITPEGGVIQIDAATNTDKATMDAIRMHLRHITADFAAGDFGAPFATHAEVPPGVPVLQRLKAAITYSFEETATGGRVRAATKNAEALSALHEFLRYQIRKHRTGDPQ